jgi:hypothetical protein
MKITVPADRAYIDGDHSTIRCRSGGVASKVRSGDIIVCDDYACATKREGDIEVFLAKHRRHRRLSRTALDSKDAGGH